MDTTFSKLVCCLLAFSFTVTRTENPTTAPVTPALNSTLTTAAITPHNNNTASVSPVSDSTENTTPFTSTGEAFTGTTAAASESTTHPQTSQYRTTTTPLTDSTTPPPETTTAGTHSPTFTEPTTPSKHTTEGYISSTPDTTVITTANPSHTVNTTSNSIYTSTQGVVLNSSERNMTIVFSVVLGVFATAMVVLMFHRCKHKIQYLHQPLNNTDAVGAFVPDDDALVISGGLYDGHPIYDNVPTAQADQSQFRLQFLQ